MLLGLISGYSFRQNLYFPPTKFLIIRSIVHSLGHFHHFRIETYTYTVCFTLPSYLSHGYNGHYKYNSWAIINKKFYSWIECMLQKICVHKRTFQNACETNIEATFHHIFLFILWSTFVHLFRFGLTFCSQNAGVFCSAHASVSVHYPRHWPLLFRIITAKITPK